VRLVSDAAASSPRRLQAWLATLVVGFVLWVAAVATLAATDDAIVLPTVVITGSFLVPVACAFWLILIAAIGAWLYRRRWRGTDAEPARPAAAATAAVLPAPPR
jgi:hypothetical protein